MSTVVVVGSGNAGFSAAHAARAAGAAVILLEKGPPEWIGGNSYFTAGAMRFCHEGLADLVSLIEPVHAHRIEAIDVPAYSANDFRADMNRVTDSRTDPELSRILISESRDAVDWLRSLDMRFELMFHRQAYEVNGRFRFWGGLAVGVRGGGKSMIGDHLAAARAAGIDVRCNAHVRGLVLNAGNAVAGVRLADGGEVRADAVVLACGGFQADPAWRASYLGPGWDLAAVRGTPLNTGDGIAMAVEAGAQTYGHFSGCHAVAWDAHAAATGDRELTNQLTRGGYPFGIVVNTLGRRFIDEGADFRNYTYAKYGAEILHQPGGRAVQIFDAKVSGLLRSEEYDSPGVTRVRADDLVSLAEQLGIAPGALSETVANYNASINDRVFDPTVKDGVATVGIDPPKSNWAQTIDTPPFTAYPVTCGITFTFGGIRVNSDGAVLDTSGNPVTGLFAAGELVGGLFYFNYPGGSGLTAGTVFGRRAGRSAAS
ncbi:FAD-dependent tricarballylate dehydrogenase TcuA [Mycobacterium spongiae]|uniref:FAD-dependent oxidoreductase n=1 Tax=Mycobacterium spongiae TaxID=886343 RepID=A0A975JU90_9MYCO|nr:FAD-dependent tricarballylate dehydrogenase TcuA [Mycobacterium spongiae]QUR65761.1 FAD-dependent oxidoreductase [Mycobacterium spongiae]